ncbi:hypothetical protein GF325_04980 [Candidatus Bathyarchaeota archaeon]|nr:hypothetical protein [Candidatus Bathyarchaeota archaeon]
MCSMRRIDVSGSKLLGYKEERVLLHDGAGILDATSFCGSLKWEARYLSEPG